MTQRKRLGRGWSALVFPPIVAVAIVAAASADSDEEHPSTVADALSQAFRHAAARALPAVVRIKVVPTASPAPRRHTPGMSNVCPICGERLLGPPLATEGVGSGVIIDGSGIILTSNHGVAQAEQVIVTLSDGRKYRTTDIRRDPYTDLAIICISTGRALPEARLGDSDKLQVGDWVVGIGNPFGLETSVTAGIVSGRDRRVPEYPRVLFLQTDAALNPGNSGGPLVNLRGEVVGIISNLIKSDTGGNGISFAVPINLAKWVVKELFEHSTVRRAILGIEVDPLSEELGEQLGVPRGDHGVVVSGVHTGGPAAQAGFQIADVIIHFENRPVRDPSQLLELVERTPAGSQVAIRILRDGQPMILNPELIAFSNIPRTDDPFRSKRATEERAFVDGRLGLMISDLTPDIAQRLGYDRDVKGVVVTGVDANGIAYEMGLREKVLIVQVGKKKVHNNRDYRAAMDGQSLKRGVLLLTKGPDGNHFVVLKQ